MSERKRKSLLLVVTAYKLHGGKRTTQRKPNALDVRLCTARHETLEFFSSSTN